ncbi:TIGR04255 family protein [Microbacterium aquilitoris]|uniref:TIGR04255 family protein n=1 Tax=Microbacterium aquilitoris TaxID=3067307 RepID=UPI00288F1410|nr:TIGR04255 family protein [Microbacterium sp. KSW2-22]MDT3343761.1 TIGR04255 family protein [Microbacterium sp. KSW2-22]
MASDAVLDRYLSNPPVVEAVAGIEFRSRGADLVALVREADNWRDRYPSVTAQGALPPSRPYGQPGGEFDMQLIDGPPPLRVWSASSDDVWLVQTQDDRVLLNWRRIRESVTYPGYEAIRPELERIVHGVEADTGADLVPLVVEFSYVNRVKSDLPGFHNAYETFRKPSQPLPGEVIAERYEITTQLEVDGGIAQLSASIQPADVPDYTILSLSTRVFATRPVGLGAAFELLDTAHATSKRAFFAIVSDDTASQWEESD